MIELPLRARDGSLRAVALIDDEDAHLARHAWSMHAEGYACRNIVADGRRRQVLLHREVLGLEHGDRWQGDHVNGNRLDCRRSNLRVATNATNGQNRHAVRAASGHRGVSWDKNRQKWMASATLDGKRTMIGRFDSADAAAAAVAAWRAEHMPYSREAREAA